MGLLHVAFGTASAALLAVATRFHCVGLGGRIRQAVKAKRDASFFIRLPLAGSTSSLRLTVAAGIGFVRRRPYRPARAGRGRHPERRPRSWQPAAASCRSARRAVSEKARWLDVGVGWRKPGSAVTRRAVALQRSAQENRPPRPPANRRRRVPFVSCLSWSWRHLPAALRHASS